MCVAEVSGPEVAGTIAELRAVVARNLCGHARPASSIIMMAGVRQAHLGPCLPLHSEAWCQARAITRHLARLGQLPPDLPRFTRRERGPQRWPRLAELKTLKKLYTAVMEGIRARARDALPLVTLTLLLPPSCSLLLPPAPSSCCGNVLTRCGAGWGRGAHRHGTHGRDQANRHGCCPYAGLLGPPGCCRSGCR